MKFLPTQDTMTEPKLASHDASHDDPKRASHRQPQTASVEPKGKIIPECSSPCRRKIPESISPCRRKRRIRIVRFSRDAAQEHSISRCRDLSVQEIHERWYNKEEYKLIGDEIRSTIKLLRNGLTDPERVGMCYRGLEHKASERGRQRSKNIIQSVDAVLLEQNQMRLRGINPDPGAIANSYCLISQHCQKDAHRVGLWDEKNAETLWRMRCDELPRMPRRTWAKGA
jgi:hypothetical protein